MDRGQRSGRMGHILKGSIMKDLKKGLENSIGMKMETSILETGFKTECMDLVNISGQMKECTLDTGIQIKWKEWEDIKKKETSMKASLLKNRRMGMEFITGKMAGNTLDGGIKESSMD
jgi:hypothetical protein